ncbi:unnamed protein product [Leptidea sinapis]|uniref:Uncharacterized protein n=1 Tax=Leptidea sinapis TaxID=189913 RepID=A0A5E4PVU8_9NEOP|nr:unnamed protein product [Leptidea sinapis]
MYQVDISEARICKRDHRKLVEYDYETDEDFSADSDDDNTFQPPPLSDSSDITDLSNYEKKLTRKRKSNWKVNITKSKRSQCVPYTNKKKVCPAKASKAIDCSDCKYKCTSNFSENDRIDICKAYWGFGDYTRQKDYTLKFEQVCAKFFQATLCISNGPINSVVKNISSVGCFLGEDKRGKKCPGNKTSDTDKILVKEHIEKFPVMEAHYVRKSSRKLYLESNLSISKMYSLYIDDVCPKNKIPVSEKTYRRIFCNEYNYSFFKPKKDLCATCSKYEQASDNEKKNLEADYTFHLIRKQQCNESKEADKLRCANESSGCLSMLTIFFI